jgi:alkyl hydroperoxide reductase subunit AhpC
VESHGQWVADIEETQGAAVKYPMTGDTDLAVAKLCNMLSAEEPGTSEPCLRTTKQPV